MEETNDGRVQHLWDMIRDIHVAMLTTIDDDGTLRSRPMASHQDYSDGNLWFFTQASSHKVFEIEGHHEVNVAFSEPTRQTYVSISGRAELVGDRGPIGQFWNDYLLTWFPKGREDPDLALLKVMPDKAEYWDSTSSAMMHVLNFVKPKGAMSPDEMGDHQKVDMKRA